MLMFAAAPPRAWKAERYELDQESSGHDELELADWGWLWDMAQPWSCTICDAPLGFVHLRPKYHCRICSKFVCASCSKSAVQLEGQTGSPKRACANCVGVSLQAPELIARLEILRARLAALSREDAALLCNLLELLPAASRHFRTWCRDFGDYLKQEPAWPGKSETFQLDGPMDIPEERAAETSSWEEVAGLTPSVLAESSCLEEDSWSCGVCDAQLGVLHLRPRHHCRMCGKSVCSKCSKSTVQMEAGQSTPQRACKSCVALALRAPVLASRLELLGRRVRARAGADAPRAAAFPPARPCGGLQDAIEFCELALESFEQEAAGQRKTPRAE